MQSIIIVGLGGFIGSCMRYLLSTYASKSLALGASFPVGTLIVNLIGSLVVGLLFHVSERLGWFQNEMKFFWFTGVLGGFTTFSSFGLETFQLYKAGQFYAALSYVLLSVGLGLALVAVGYKIGAIFRL